MTLDEFLHAWAAKPFEWGRTDCVQFAVAWMRESIGLDHSTGYSYDDAVSAQRIINAAGGLEALFSKHYGPMRRTRLGVSAGDVILSAFDHGPTLGLAFGPRAFVLKTQSGLIPVQMELAIGYWPCQSQSPAP